MKTTIAKQVKVSPYRSIAFTPAKCSYIGFKCSNCALPCNSKQAINVQLLTLNQKGVKVMFDYQFSISLNDIN